MLDTTKYGILGQPAPRWDANTWFNLPEGEANIDVSNYKGKIVYLYCFQSWCPGCHKTGFPTLKAMQELFKDDNNVKFVAIQTVFEGYKNNTLHHAKEIAREYDLEIPFGHDTGPDNLRSAIMQSYRTGGTPWTVLIDPDGIVRFNDFHVDVEFLLSLHSQTVLR